MSTYQVIEKDIPTIVSEEIKARESVTDEWINLWSLYKTRPILERDDEDSSWKSRLNDGKAFEIIETVGSYIRNALFFSDAWVKIDSNEPGLDEPGNAITPIVSKFFADTLNKSNLRREFRVFLTQLLLCGYSAMYPYYDEDKKLCFEAINNYDVYIDSSKRYNPNTSYSFRRIQLNYGEFENWVSDGYLDISEFKSTEDAWTALSDSQNSNRQSDLYANRDTTQLDECDFIVVCEFYEPNEKCLYRFVDDYELGKEEDVECPWIVAFLFETPEDCYALSLLSSSLGLIYTNNYFQNKRLDSLALSVDNMWLFVDDGVTDPASIKSKPGSVIQVGRPDSIVPMPFAANNTALSYQEQLNLEQKIDKNTGTGAVISANTFRQGERVTAKEINAVKEAGGNRLTDIYNHIEQTFVVPLLYKSLSILQKHIKKAAVVRVFGDESGVYDFFQLLPKDLQHNYLVSVTATQSVINRDKNISLLNEFLATVSQVPQFQEMINYENLYSDLLYQYGFDNPDRYIINQSKQALEPQSPQSASEQMISEARAIGGDPMANAVQSDIATQGATQTLADFTGEDLSELDNAELMQSEQLLNTPL